MSVSRFLHFGRENGGRTAAKWVKGGIVQQVNRAFAAVYEYHLIGCRHGARVEHQLREGRTPFA